MDFGIKRHGSAFSKLEPKPKLARNRTQKRTPKPPIDELWTRCLELPRELQLMICDNLQYIWKFKRDCFLTRSSCNITIYTYTKKFTFTYHELRTFFKAAPRRIPNSTFSYDEYFEDGYLSGLEDSRSSETRLQRSARTFHIPFRTFTVPGWGPRLSPTENDRSVFQDILQRLSLLTFKIDVKPRRPCERFDSLENTEWPQSRLLDCPDPDAYRYPPLRYEYKQWHEYLDHLPTFLRTLNEWASPALLNSRVTVLQNFCFAVAQPGIYDQQWWLLCQDIWISIHDQGPRRPSREGSKFVYLGCEALLDRPELKAWVGSGLKCKQECSPPQTIKDDCKVCSMIWQPDGSYFPGILPALEQEFSSANARIAARDPRERYVKFEDLQDVFHQVVSHLSSFLRDWCTYRDLIDDCWMDKRQIKPCIFPRPRLSEEDSNEARQL